MLYWEAQCPQRSYNSKCPLCCLPQFYPLGDWLCPLPSVQEEAVLNDTMAASPSYAPCDSKLQLNMGWNM